MHTNPSKPQLESHCYQNANVLTVYRFTDLHNVNYTVMFLFKVLSIVSYKTSVPHLRAHKELLKQIRDKRIKSVIEYLKKTP